MIQAGVAVVDITPPAGLAMAGFAARTKPAIGAHDPLSLRALALGESIILLADVIGVDRALCERVATALSLAPEYLLIAASHTHGGPASMSAGLGQQANPDFLHQLECACIEAAQKARAARAPARLFYGEARDPGFAHNRRHAHGPVDRSIPVLRLETEGGCPLALLAITACHPVVLGADNLRWTADYPFFLRRALEQSAPGLIAIAATGFCGDVNTGHNAAASFSTTAQANRSFTQAQKMGEALAQAILDCPLTECEDYDIIASCEDVTLEFSPETTPPSEQARLWRAEAATAPEPRANLLRIWGDWAEQRCENPAPFVTKVYALALGPLRFIGLPGEIFAQCALDLRAELAQHFIFLFAYAGDNPGYIAPAQEYVFGGYEIEEAHRFYGQPAAFKMGSAEKLTQVALRLCQSFDNKSISQPQGV